MVQSGAEGSGSEAADWWRAVGQAQRAMSVDMSSQASDSNEEFVDDDDEDAAEGDIKYYYDNLDEDVAVEEPFDPEEYQFNCLTYRESQRVLTEEVNNVASALKVCFDSLYDYVYR